MALGEEILLYRVEDAENMVRFAKKHKCSASKRVLTSIHTEMNLKGSLQKFQDYSAAQRSETSPSGQEEKDALDEAEKEMHHRKTLLAKFFADYSIGERIDHGPDWDHLQELTVSERPDQQTLSPDDEAFLRDRYLVLVLLQENGLVETRESGMYLRGVVEPGEAITEYPADLLPEQKSEDLAAHELSRQITTYSETAYPVTLGPESVLMIELEELEEFCKSCEVDEDALAAALMNQALKKMIVDKLILFFRETKKTTKEEVVAQMRDFELTIPDTVDHFSFHLHTSFIEEVLDDLRRMRTIQGKDSRIRYVGD